MIVLSKSLKTNIYLNYFLMYVEKNLVLNFYSYSVSQIDEIQN